VAAEVKRSYAAASRFGTEVSDRVHTVFVGAMHVGLLSGAGAVLAAAMATLVLLTRRPRTARAADSDRVALADASSMAAD
jgi:hypothetical protein